MVRTTIGSFRIEVSDIRALALVPALLAACAHQPTTDRPVALTPELLAHLRVALADQPVIQIDDGDCAEADRTRINASFEELRESLVKHGFTVVERDTADVVFEHRTHVTTCTFDGRVKGSSQLIAKDRSGRTVDIASLFPLWPEGLVDLILTSERLAAFARNTVDRSPARRASRVGVSAGSLTPQSPPPPLQAVLQTATATVASFSLLPLEGEIEPALADQLLEYLVLKLTEGGRLVRDDRAPDALKAKFLRVADRCVLQAALSGRAATERATCDTDALMDAADRIAKALQP